MKAKAIFLSLLCVLFLQRTQAVQVSIAKDGRDAVLSWQSSAGEKFMIQQRPDFNTNSVWSTLTNLYPAATGTNVTTYRLVNVFPPANTNISQSGGGGSSNGPPVFSMSAGSSTSSSDSATAAKSKKAIAFPPLPGLPPIPWDQSTWGTTSPQLTKLFRTNGRR